VASFHAIEREYPYPAVEWGLETSQPVFAGGIPRHTFLWEGVPEDHLIAIARLQDLPTPVQMP
jgi:hypothetical protein